MNLEPIIQNEASQKEKDKYRILTHIHMEYHSTIKNNAFESVLMRWMKLEPIIQNEANQKEKDKYCIPMYMESRKMVVKNLFAGQQWRNRHREQNYGHAEHACKSGGHIQSIASSKQNHIV